MNPNHRSRPARDVGPAPDSAWVKAYTPTQEAARDVAPARGYTPTREAALARIAAVRPSDYARSRNALGGAVSGLSPYITHGLVSLREVLAGVTARQPLDVQHKFVYELGWREYFRHVWQFRGEAIFSSLHEGLLPDDCYAPVLPPDIREAATGVPVIDQAVRTLYDSGYLHNHARMWLASYVVHLRKVHWRVAADWLYGHLLDGDLASNHLSWQWVAGTGSSKPYLFNADNVARYAPSAWHSAGSVVDQSYEALDQIAREPVLATTALRDPTDAGAARTVANRRLLQIEPPLSTQPPADLDIRSVDAAIVAGRRVWLCIHGISGNCLPICPLMRWWSVFLCRTFTRPGPGASGAGGLLRAAWRRSRRYCGWPMRPILAPRSRARTRSAAWRIHTCIPGLLNGPISRPRPHCFPRSIGVAIRFRSGGRGLRAA